MSESMDAFEAGELLASLVDKSLVVFDEAEGRYRLIETVRHYSWEKLNQSCGAKSAQERHRDFFLALAEEAEPHLKGPEQAEWYDHLEVEHENLREALEWSLGEERPDAGLRLCVALRRYWWTRGYLSEGLDWCQRALGRAGGEERTKERAGALNGAGVLAKLHGDYALALTYHEESLSIRREIGDSFGIALSLNNLGNLAHSHGEYASARNSYQESLSIHREIGGRMGIALSLYNLGNLALDQGDYASARAYHEESLSNYLEIGNRIGIAESFLSLGTVARSLGDYASARTFLEDSLSIRREIGDELGIALSLEAFALLMAGQQLAECVARLCGLAEVLREKTGSPLALREREEYDREVASARQALGPELFSQAWAAGREMKVEDAITLALQGPES